MADRLLQSSGSIIRFHYPHSIPVSHSLGRRQSNLFLPLDSSPQPRHHQLQQQPLLSATSRFEQNYFPAKRTAKGLHVTTSKRVNIRSQKVSKQQYIPQLSKEQQYFLQTRQLRQENSEMIRRLVFAEQVQRELKLKLEMFEKKLLQFNSPNFSTNEKQSGFQQLKLKCGSDSITLQHQFKKQWEKKLQQSQILKKQICQQRQLVSSTLFKLHTLQAEISELTKTIQNHQKQSKKKEQDIFHLQRSLAEKDQLISALRSQRQISENSHQELISQMNRQLEANTKEILYLKATLESEHQMRLSLGCDLAKTLEKSKIEIGAIKRLTQQSQASRKQKQRLEKQLQKVSNQLQQTLREMKSMQYRTAQQQLNCNQRTRLNCQLDELRINVKVLEEEIEALSLTVRQLTDKYQMVLTQITQQHNSLQEISAKIQEARSSLQISDINRSDEEKRPFDNHTIKTQTTLQNSEFAFQKQQLQFNKHQSLFLQYQVSHSPSKPENQIETKQNNKRQVEIAEGNFEKQSIKLQTNFKPQIGLKNQEFNDPTSVYREQIHSSNTQIKAVRMYRQDVVLQLENRMKTTPQKWGVQKVDSDQQRHEAGGYERKESRIMGN